MLFLRKLNTLKRLFENWKKSDIEIYQSTDGQTEVEVTFDNETVWLNQDQMSQLFGRDRTVIGRHIRNVFKEGELIEEVVCADFAHTTKHSAIEGKTQTKKATYYNLDVTISVILPISWPKRF